MNFPTFPARPVNGGPLPKARPKTPGDWYYEPKLNDGRALVNGFTGEMWNRQGQPLTTSDCFNEARRRLQQLARDTYIEWWDCLTLERRHDICKGTIVVLDWIPTSPTFHPPWYSRKQFIHRHLGEGLIVEFPSLLSCVQTWTQTEAAKAWDTMQIINRRLGCDFYEGVVAKQADSPYPIQLRSPDQETPAWIKHRWQF